VHIGRDQTRTAKGSKRFAAKVPDWLLGEITQWRKYADIDDGYIFPRSQDALERPITGDIVYDIVKKAAARAGLEGKIAPHGLRRSNITISGELGVSLKARQLAVGHSQSGTTEKYDRARDATTTAPGDVFAEMMKPKK
jgi:integrase/recombinase XerD